MLDAAGIEVTELPYLPYAEVAGETVAAELPELLHLQRRR